MAVQISGNDITVPRDGSFTRNVTIGGTLTYEDVTNIDSVGLVTARTGIEIGARPGVAASISVDGNMIISGISTFGDDITFTGATSGRDVVFDTSLNQMRAQDNAKLCAGTSSDLEIYHNATNSFLDNYTGALFLRNNVSSDNGGNIVIQAKVNEDSIVCNDDGAVELYHDNSKKLETSADGAIVTGELDVFKSGVGDVLHVRGNGTGAVVAKVENAYNSDNDRFAILELKSGKGSIRFNSNGDSNEGAITYNMADNTMVFGVNNATERMRIDSSGRLLIGTTSTSGISGNADDLIIGSTNDSSTRGLTLASTTNANIRFSDDGDSATGMIEYNHSSNFMRIYVEGGEAMRIDSSRNTHFGSSGSLNNANTVSIIPSDGRISFGMDGRDSLVTGESGAYIFSGQGSSGSPLAGELILQSRSNVDRDIFFATGSSPTFRARFRGSDGDFFLGNDLATISNVGTAIRENDAGQNTYIEMGHGTTGANYSYFICRFGGSGTNIGGIAQNSSGNGVTFNTSSDYRLKENVVGITSAITRLKTLKPYRFNFISDASTTVDGFFAHEVTAVPEAIIGTKDEVDSDNNPVYQGIDQSKLVPLLTAALQEAITKIETLETKVATLEGS